MPGNEKTKLKKEKTNMFVDVKSIAKSTKVFYEDTKQNFRRVPQSSLMENNENL